MNYFTRMKRLLLLDETVYRELVERKLMQQYCIINVSIAGIIYGLSSVYFSRVIMNSVQTFNPFRFDALLVVLVGISMAFLMHAGAALFLWVSCRGISGTARFLPIYMTLGVSCIGFWPLAPALSALIAGVSGPLIYAFTITITTYLLILGYTAVRWAAELSKWKMIVAGLATIIYVGCFLYLWM